MCSLADEVRLKSLAAERSLLVMGPDCGSAIVNGVPLGFANVVRSGNVGIIAASGTGLQEVSCLIDRLGGGISQALGTGGRDLSAEVGGLSMRCCLEMLAADPETRVIVLVSKPPSPAVASSRSGRGAALGQAGRRLLSGERAAMNGRSGRGRARANPGRGSAACCATPRVWHRLRGQLGGTRGPAPARCAEVRARIVQRRQLLLRSARAAR